MGVTGYRDEGFEVKTSKSVERNFIECKSYDVRSITHMVYKLGVHISKKCLDSVPKNLNPRLAPLAHSYRPPILNTRAG